MESSSKLNTSYVHNALVDLVDENHPNLKNILIYFLRYWRNQKKEVKFLTSNNGLWKDEMVVNTR